MSQIQNHYHVMTGLWGSEGQDCQKIVTSKTAAMKACRDEMNADWGDIYDCFGGEPRKAKVSNGYRVQVANGSQVYGFIFEKCEKPIGECREAFDDVLQNLLKRTSDFVNRAPDGIDY